MKQNILRKLMLIAVLLTGSHAFAHDFEVDGIYYNIIQEGYVEVTYKGDYLEDTFVYSGSVVIPKTVTYNSNIYIVMKIGNYAFYDCRFLASVTIPNLVIIIGKEAFSGCCLTSITIPCGVRSIEERAFCDCSYLKSIAVEEGNPVYDSRDNCNAIIETATNTLIAGCENTIIPNSVTSIGDNAFSGCSGLTSITIPNSVTSIGDNAFLDCSGLISITIPNSVTSIGNKAFSGCTGLTEIICKNATPATAYYNTFNSVPTTATLYVPVGSKEAYASATGWSYFSNIVENDEITGLENTLADNDVNVSIENGNIVIGGAGNAKVEVYNVNGQCVYSGNSTSIPMTAKGLYIVKVNGKSFKVML